MGTLFLSPLYTAETCKPPTASWETIQVEQGTMFAVFLLRNMLPCPFYAMNLRSTVCCAPKLLTRLEKNLIDMVVKKCLDPLTQIQPFQQLFSRLVLFHRMIIFYKLGLSASSKVWLSIEISQNISYFSLRIAVTSVIQLQHATIL